MRKVEACNDPSLEFSEQARYTFNVRERDRHREREREGERERETEIWSILTSSICTN